MRRPEAAALVAAAIALMKINAASETFGVIPNAFPRSTVEFNTYAEQMAIGQVLETLVTSDQYGNVAASVADRWEVRDGGRRIVFHLRGNREYSDGRDIMPGDVVASLSRHWKDPRSQSFPLLQNIRSIEASGEASVVVVLDHPQVSIFKILSRDHLGIMPSDHSFSLSSPEPFIGSGPYRLVKEAGGWTYIKNPRYRRAAAVSIPRWKIAPVPSAIEDLDKIPDFPDYVPAVRQGVIDILKKNPRFRPADFDVHPRFGFSQVTGWWNPHSQDYADETSRHVQMGALRMLFARRRTARGLPTAFGLIPRGVSGHLEREIPFPDLTRQDVEKAAARRRGVTEIRVGVPARLKDEIFAPGDVRAVETALGVRFIVAERPGYAIPRSSVDIIIDSWAGGFNDPEGFIPIITDIAAMPLDEYLGSLREAYRKASRELDWTRRSAMFREFDRDLVRQERMVPGWRMETFTLIRKDLEEADGGFRYTPRLMDVRKR